MSRVTVNVNGLSLVHEDSGGVSTATLPDVCLTPGAGAVPYPNVALSRDLAGGSTLVRADGGHRVAVAGSSCARSAGGEPGSGGGVTSGVSGREATFLTHSFDVTIEGRGACRLTDKMLHNRGNTINCAGHLQDEVVVERPAGAGKSRASTISPWKRLPAAASIPKVTHGVDSNNSTLSTSHCLSRKPKRKFVGRYLISDGKPDGTSNGVNPGLTPHEVQRLNGHGMEVFAIWEVTKYRALETGTTDGQFALGQHDAKIAKHEVERCGLKGRPIYFTADFKVTPQRWHQQVMLWLPLEPGALDLCPAIVALYQETGESAHTMSLVKHYFQGIKSVLHPNRIGAYGAVTTVSKLFKLGYIEWGWQWAFGGRINPRCQLLQTNADYDPDPAGDNSGPWHVTGQGALDFDRATVLDFGQWPVPGSTKGGST